MVQAVHPVWGNRSCFRFGIYSETLDEEHTTYQRFKNKRLRYSVVAGMVLVTTLLVGVMVYDMLSGYGMPTREKDAVQHLLMLRRTTTIPTPVIVTSIASTFATTSKTNTTPSPNLTTPSIAETTEASVDSTPQAFNSTEDISLLSSTENNFILPNSSLPSNLIEGMLVEASLENARSEAYRSTEKEYRSSIRRFGKQRNSEPYEFVREFPQHRPAPKHSEANAHATYDKENYPMYWVPPHVLSEAEVQSRIMNRGTQLVPRPFRAKNFTSERPANNRIKIIKEDETAIPYYSIGASSKYAQLSSYRYPNAAKNIQDIIKYLTTSDSSKSPSEKQPQTIVFRPSMTNGRKIKFAGVYKTAEKEDSGETYSRPEESSDDYTISGLHGKDTDPSLNGHAYIADPFHAFKPSDPSEINLLANSDFRFSPLENRIRITAKRQNGNRWSYSEPNLNDNYFPRPPINFGKPNTMSQQNNHHEPVVHVYPGTYTTATFKPLGSDTPGGTTSSSSKKQKKVKPFSVMLDIYPMMEDSYPQASSHSKVPVKPKRRPGHGFGRIKFPPNEHPPRPPDQMAAETSTENKHQMVVHLNLYPRKKKNQNISNRNDDSIQTFHVDVKSNPDCCSEETVYEEEVVDENVETEDKKEINKGGQDMPWQQLSELLHGQKNSDDDDAKQPRAVISGDSTANVVTKAEDTSEVTTQEHPGQFHTIGEFSHHPTNHRLENEQSRPLLNIELAPNNSSIHKQENRDFSEFLNTQSLTNNRPNSPVDSIPSYFSLTPD